jgi:hypothetical protein
MHAVSRTVVACTLVCALAMPAVSSAQDVRGSAATSSLAGSTSTPSQDLRAPDSRDAASGRGTLGAPAAAVVKLPEPPQAAPVRGNPTIDRDGGLYVVVALLGLFLLAVGGTAVAQRRQGGAWVASAA